MVLRYILTGWLTLILLGLFSSCDSGQPKQKVIKKIKETSKTNFATPFYETHCAVCHGNDGTAGISGAADLQASTLNNGAIENIINNGRGNMPSFKSTSSESEIKQVAVFVRSLRK